MLTNPPFAKDKDRPPFHLRPWDEDELAQFERMLAKHKEAHPQGPVREPCAS
jgi:hypothetical protein